MVYNCPQCGKSLTTRLKDSWLLTCTNCEVLVAGDERIAPQTFQMPDDWSAIQIGTTGLYKNKNFTVVGRARLQMNTDFLNLWCAYTQDGPLWIGQSLEKIGFFASVFTPFPQNRYKETRAGLMIDFSDTIRLKCEMVEPCIALHMEGELHRLPVIKAGFTFVQASNDKGNTVFVFATSQNAVEFLWGELLMPDSIKFSNIREFNDWK